MKRRDWYKKTYKKLVITSIYSTVLGIAFTLFLQCFFYGFGILQLVAFFLFSLIFIRCYNENYRYLVEHKIIENDSFKHLCILFPGLLFSAFVLIINIVPMKTEFGWIWAISTIGKFISERVSQ